MSDDPYRPDFFEDLRRRYNIPDAKKGRKKRKAEPPRHLEQKDPVNTAAQFRSFVNDALAENRAEMLKRTERLYQPFERDDAPTIMEELGGSVTDATAGAQNAAARLVRQAYQSTAELMGRSSYRGPENADVRAAARAKPINLYPWFNKHPEMHGFENLSAVPVSDVESWLYGSMYRPLHILTKGIVAENDSADYGEMFTHGLAAIGHAIHTFDETKHQTFWAHGAVTALIDNRNFMRQGQRGNQASHFGPHFDYAIDALTGGAEYIETETGRIIGLDNDLGFTQDQFLLSGGTIRGLQAHLDALYSEHIGMDEHQLKRVNRNRRLYREGQSVLLPTGYSPKHEHDPYLTRPNPLERFRNEAFGATPPVLTEYTDFPRFDPREMDEITQFEAGYQRLLNASLGLIAPEILSELGPYEIELSTGADLINLLSSAWEKPADPVPRDPFFFLRQTLNAPSGNAPAGLLFQPGHYRQDNADLPGRIVAWRQPTGIPLQNPETYVDLGIRMPDSGRPFDGGVPVPGLHRERRIRRGRFGRYGIGNRFVDGRLLTGETHIRTAAGSPILLVPRTAQTVHQVTRYDMLGGDPVTEELRAGRWINIGDKYSRPGRNIGFPLFGRVSGMDMESETLEPYKNPVVLQRRRVGSDIRWLPQELPGGYGMVTNTLLDLVEEYMGLTDSEERKAHPLRKRLRGKGTSRLIKHLKQLEATQRIVHYGGKVGTEDPELDEGTLEGAWKPEDQPYDDVIVRNSLNIPRTKRRGASAFTPAGGAISSLLEMYGNDDDLVPVGGTPSNIHGVPVHLGSRLLPASEIEIVETAGIDVLGDLAQKMGHDAAVAVRILNQYLGEAQGEGFYGDPTIISYRGDRETGQLPLPGDIIDSDNLSYVVAGHLGRGDYVVLPSDLYTGEQDNQFYGQRFGHGGSLYPNVGERPTSLPAISSAAVGWMTKQLAQSGYLPDPRYALTKFSNKQTAQQLINILGDDAKMLQGRLRDLSFDLNKQKAAAGLLPMAQKKPRQATPRTTTPQPYRPGSALQRFMKQGEYDPEALSDAGHYIPGIHSETLDKEQIFDWMLRASKADLSEVPEEHMMKALRSRAHWARIALAYEFPEYADKHMYQGKENEAPWKEWLETLGDRRDRFDFLRHELLAEHEELKRRHKHQYDAGAARSVFSQWGIARDAIKEGLATIDVIPWGIDDAKGASDKMKASAPPKPRASVTPALPPPRAATPRPDQLAEAASSTPRAATPRAATQGTGRIIDLNASMAIAEAAEHAGEVDITPQLAANVPAKPRAATPRTGGGAGAAAGGGGQQPPPQNPNDPPPPDPEDDDGDAGDTTPPPRRATTGNPRSRAQSGGDRFYSSYWDYNPPEGENEQDWERMRGDADASGPGDWDPFASNTRSYRWQWDAARGNPVARQRFVASMQHLSRLSVRSRLTKQLESMNKNWIRPRSSNLKYGSAVTDDDGFLTGFGREVSERDLNLGMDIARSGLSQAIDAGGLQSGNGASIGATLAKRLDDFILKYVDNAVQEAERKGHSPTQAKAHGEKLRWIAREYGNYAIDKMSTLEDVMDEALNPTADRRTEDAWWKLNADRGLRYGRGSGSRLRAAAAENPDLARLINEEYGGDFDAASDGPSTVYQDRATGNRFWFGSGDGKPPSPFSSFFGGGNRGRGGFGLLYGMYMTSRIWGMTAGPVIQGADKYSQMIASTGPASMYGEEGGTLFGTPAELAYQKSEAEYAQQAAAYRTFGRPLTAINRVLADENVQSALNVGKLAGGFVGAGIGGGMIAASLGATSAAPIIAAGGAIAGLTIGGAAVHNVASRAIWNAVGGAIMGDEWKPYDSWYDPASRAWEWGRGIFMDAAQRDMAIRDPEKAQRVAMSEAQRDEDRAREEELNIKSRDISEMSKLMGRATGIDRDRFMGPLASMQNLWGRKITRGSGDMRAVQELVRTAAFEGADEGAFLNEAAGYAEMQGLLPSSAEFQDAMLSYAGMTPADRAASISRYRLFGNFGSQFASFGFSQRQGTAFSLRMGFQNQDQVSASTSFMGLLSRYDSTVNDARLERIGLLARGLDPFTAQQYANLADADVRGGADAYTTMKRLRDKGLTNQQAYVANMLFGLGQAEGMGSGRMADLARFVNLDNRQLGTVLGAAPQLMAGGASLFQVASAVAGTQWSPMQSALFDNLAPMALGSGYGIAPFSQLISGANFTPQQGAIFGQVAPLSFSGGFDVGNVAQAISGMPSLNMADTGSMYRMSAQLSALGIDPAKIVSAFSSMTGGAAALQRQWRQDRSGATGYVAPPSAQVFSPGQRMFAEATVGNIALAGGDVEAYLRLVQQGEMSVGDANLYSRMAQGDPYATSWYSYQPDAGPGAIAGRFFDQYRNPIFHTDMSSFYQMMSAHADQGSMPAQNLLGNLRLQPGQPVTPEMITDTLGVTDPGLAQAFSVSQREAGLYMNQRMYENTMAGIGIGFARIALQRNYMYGANRGGTWDAPAEGSMWALEDQQRQMQYQSRMYDFAYSERQMRAQNQYAIFQEGLTSRRMDLNRGFQLWASGFEYTGMQLQQQWTQQGWQRADQMTQLQYGWQMEDFDEAIRSSSGRQRRQLVRQRDRATTQYNLEQENTDAQRKQQEEMWKREEERYKRKVQYEAQIHQIEKEGFNAAVKNRQDMFKMEMDHLAYKKKEFEKEFALQEEMIALSRKYQEDSLNLQAASLGVQAEAADLQKQYQDAMLQLETSNNDNYNRWKEINTFDTAKATLDALRLAMGEADKIDPSVFGDLRNLATSLQVAGSSQGAAVLTRLVNEINGLSIERANLIIQILSSI